MSTSPIGFSLRHPFAPGNIPQGGISGGVYSGIDKLGVFKESGSAASLSTGGLIGAGVLGALPDLINGDIGGAAFSGGGAAAGAAIGTAIMPGIGTILGGVAGRFLGRGLGKLFGFGKKKEKKQQQEALRQLQFRQRIAETQQVRLENAYLRGRLEGMQSAMQQQQQQGLQPQLAGYLSVNAPVNGALTGLPGMGCPQSSFPGIPGVWAA